MLILRFVFAVCLMMPMLVSAGSSWPDLPIPTGGRLGTLGQDIKLGGVPIRIYGGEFYNDFDYIKNYYKTELNKIGFMSPSETPTEGKGVILFQVDTKGEYSYSVTLSPQMSNSTQGSIMIMHIAGIEKTPYPIELPFGASVGTDMESNDRGRKGRLLQILTKGDYDGFKADIINQLATQGYKLESDGYKRSKKGSEMMHFQAEGGRGAHIIFRDGKLQSPSVAEMTLTEQPR